MEASLDAFGRVDVVFANAGFGAARGFLKEDSQLVISDNAHVIFPWHKLLDSFREKVRGGSEPLCPADGHAPLRAAFERASAEYVASHRYNADRAEAACRGPQSTAATDSSKTATFAVGNDPGGPGRRNPGFDQHDPPDDGGVDPAAIVAVRLSQ